ncbi:hypothetical protein EJB05_29583, partial [Eragrostis curvula]
MFKKVKTTWVSHLPKACYVWNWTGSSSSSSSSSSGWFKGGTFEDLTLLHISYCPRIVQVIHFPIVSHALDRLETLEITWCGDVSVAFHGYDLPRRFRAWQFPKLKHIRLHELPKLQKICNFASRIMTPELQTIKIRGCWSLRTLPVVRTGDPWWGTILPTVESGNAVECNCEKKWWDMLEWESEAHASHYKPIHPRHYKKTMLRGSVLSIGSWFDELCPPSSSQLAKGTWSLIILIIWHIWRQRNDRVFERIEKPINQVITEIKDEISLWSMAGAKHLAALVGRNSSE